MMNKKILVADDLMGARLVVTTMLELLGYEYDEAHDGDQAVELLEENEYDLLLTDVEMPGMNGFEVCEHIRDTFPDHKKWIPVIVISGHPLDDFDEKQTRYGLTNFLTKPFNEDDMKNMLHRYCR